MTYDDRAISALTEHATASAPRCERCHGAHDHTTPLCCSAHRKALCHACYRRTHFVEFCDCPLCAPQTAATTPTGDDVAAQPGGSVHPSSRSRRATNSKDPR